MSEFMNSPVTENDLEAEKAVQTEQENVQDKAESVQGTPETAQKEAEDAQKTEKVTADEAVKKLDAELKSYTGKGKGQLAKCVVAYLKKRALEDHGLVEDVLQKHKSLTRCIDYIYAEAKKQATGGYAAVSDETVYEWAEDYFHKDDKAEAERAAKAKPKKSEMIKTANKKAAELKAPIPKSEPEKVSEEKVNEDKQAKKESKAQASKPKKKKEPKESLPDGQMDLFSMFGL